MKNPIKKKLKEGKVSIGGWTNLNYPTSAEIMARSGFEWIVIDMEHSAIGVQDVENMVRAIELGGSVPLVRLWGNDPVLVKKVMEAGAYGIIVPMINSPQEAEKAVKSIKYPPDGERGVGLYRAQGFGADFEDYKNTINEESLVIVQIEHKKAVENIKEILSVKGVDGLIIGPYDMSGSFGVPGQLDHLLVKEAQVKVLAAAKEAGVVAGIHVVHPPIEQVKEKIKEGFKFIAYGTDAEFLKNQSREAVSKIKGFE
ncbi:MAG: aldolase/citrate lyase family protein [Candidatus Nealsonbacteria bacterium]